MNYDGMLMMNWVVNLSQAIAERRLMQELAAMDQDAPAIPVYNVGSA